MKRYINRIAILFFLIPACITAQEEHSLRKDTVFISEKILIEADTLRMDSLIGGEVQLMPKKFKPDSKKATIYAAIFPGLGQIYNRKYWKLPLVYGSFIGCAYAISWNGGQYSGYQKAYRDFIDNDPTTNSWNDYVYASYRREEFENWTEEMKRSFSNALKSARDFHRRNRDLSYIVTVGVYAIWIIDAYVDAQLFEFDVSPDLSMRVEPVLFDRTTISSRSVGMQLSFAF